MTLRATYRAPGADGYRRAGGAWDVPTLDVLMSRNPVAGDAAVVDGRHRIGSSTLDGMVAGLAGSLRWRGVRRGQIVTWQLPNWFEAVVLFRACWRIGAVAAPIHHQVGSAEVAPMVGVLEPAVAFAAPDLPLADLDGVVPVRGDDDGFVDWLAGSPVTVSPSRPADLAVVIFTSGSTGAPRAVLHTHRGLATKALTMGSVHGLSGADAVLMPAPMAHVSGLLNAVLVPGVHGMRAVLMERWDADRGLALIEEERISFMIGPPPLFTSVLDHPAFEPSKVSSLRVVSSGMMGVSPEFIERAGKELGAVVKRSYGSTEAPTVSTCTNEDPPERRRNSDGRAIGETELRVVDPETHRRRRAGQVGEVWIRGPELFAGYAEAAETAAATHRGWFRSGDLGTLDDGGWLTVTGRLKDLIIRGGENISAAEVERALELHPDVAQAVVVGCPDPRLGERVAAFVVARAPIDVAECRRWFEEHGVARFKTPEVVVRVDHLPLLAAGKPDRAALRGRAAALAVSP